MNSWGERIFSPARFRSLDAVERGFAFADFRASDPDEEDFKLSLIGVG